MSYLEVRRHSWRQPTGGSQLSQRGVDLARRIGATSGPYAKVVTSVLPRARETALAMGFAVDQLMVTQLADEAVYADLNAESAADNQWDDDPYPLRALADRIAGQAGQQGPQYRLASIQSGLWRDLMTPYSDGDERVLLITHSGDLEYGLVGSLPDADHRGWGGTFGPMEGAVLEFSGEPAYFRGAEILRIE